MPEIVDIMTIPMANAGSFVADTSGVDFVAGASQVGTFSFINKLGNKKFTKGDSLRLLSAGIVLPESFTISKQLLFEPLPFVIVSAVGAVSAALYYNPNFSGNYIYLPFENYEMVLDVFFSCRDAYQPGFPNLTLLLEDFYLKGNTPSVLNISMFGVPAAMDGKTFYFHPFIKVLHTIPLT